MAGRTLAGPQYPGDDGSADSRVTAALAAYATGQGGEHAVLAALRSSRLLVPVVALLARGGDPPGTPRWPKAPFLRHGVLAELAEEEAAAPGALRREKSSEMALPTVIGADGRAALPAFTSAASLARWRPQARPVPVPAAQVWRSGAQDASAVIIDIAGPVPFAVDGARLAALAQGSPAPMPHEDPDVVALIHAALAAEPAIAGYRLLPGEDGTDLTLCLVPVPGYGPAEPGVTGAAQRACERLLAGAGDRVRRGVEVALLEPAGPGPVSPGPGPAGRAGAGA